MAFGNIISISLFQLPRLPTLSYKFEIKIIGNILAKNELVD
jgi:hypothetical protein